jgi:hypothetical protein
MHFIGAHLNGVIQVSFSAPYPRGVLQPGLMQMLEVKDQQNQPSIDSELTILLPTVSKHRKTDYLRHTAEDLKIDLHHGYLGPFKS